jgi:hypothetical protein
VDHATKVSLVVRVAGTTAARDACAALAEAIEAAERLTGRRLADESVDPVTGELVPLVVVTDNGVTSATPSKHTYFRQKPSKS